ncbi:MAG: penicillin-binding protein 2 [Candidatus Curtissbacteria bacterium]|nr:penicillin-binding protein 2 [Candidatus Curtissbacteria bacterium]
MIDRLNIFKFLIFVFALAIVARLFYWQFLSTYSGRNVYSQENEIPPTRGEIFASDNFPLVTNQEAFLIYAKPKELKEDPAALAKKIAPFLISEKYARPPSTEAPPDFELTKSSRAGVGSVGQATNSAALSPEEQKQKDGEIKNIEADLTKKLSDKNLFWVQIARKITKDIKQKIEDLKIAGFGFESDDKRLYPEASMAAQLLGFVGSDKFGKDIGYFGLEGYYDKQIRGKPGRIGSEKDPFGFPILVGKYREVKPQKGASLYTTLDRVVQFIVEQKLAQAVERYGAKDGSVIVVDPKTGHILAMATYPNYNPAFFSEFDPKLYRNPVVADTYEPGSTFKLVTMSAALELSVVGPETRCNVCSGPRQIGGFEISTWNKKYYPDTTMTEVIQHSDNIGMTFVADKLGLDRLYSYINKFGFGRKTGIDLQEETPAPIRAKDDWRKIDLATASFGQGIAVTPIQMLEAVGAIANGGKLISPKVVAKIVDRGQEELIRPDLEKQIISPKTAAQITEMMVNAVDHGEAQAFKPQGFRIAGKTGTAQIPLAGHYDPNKTIASFVGFAPADDPKFVMIVRFTEPTSSPFGSETAAPTFFAIAKDLFNYYGIPQNR